MASSVENPLVGRIFKAQSMLDIHTWSHDRYPVFDTSEFTFFRCLSFSHDFYGLTISALHDGNLRASTGRYSKLFPGQRISYWASDRDTAKREVASHEDCRDYILFEAYDDASSFIPSLPCQTPLRVADGRNTQFGELLEKAEKGVPLDHGEKRVIEGILELDLDCLAYTSHANPKGENFLFFEKGFRKLALRDVRLVLGSRKSRNAKSVRCATTSDYLPHIKSYGMRFEPIARAVMDDSYLETDEYRLRKLLSRNR